MIVISFVNTDPAPEFFMFRSVHVLRIEMKKGNTDWRGRRL